MRLVLPGRFGAEPLICEDIRGVIEHDIEDDVEAVGVGRVDKRPQLLRRAGGVGREARLDREEILDTVAVIGARVRRAIERLAVLQHGREPERADAESLEIPQLLLDAREGTPPEGVARAIVRGVARRRGRIIEAIDHQEVDPLVAPVRGRREGRRNRDLFRIDGHDARHGPARGIERRLYGILPDRRRHLSLRSPNSPDGADGITPGARPARCVGHANGASQKL